MLPRSGRLLSKPESNRTRSMLTGAALSMYPLKPTVGPTPAPRPRSPKSGTSATGCVIGCVTGSPCAEVIGWPVTGQGVDGVQGAHDGAQGALRFPRPNPDAGVTASGLTKLIELEALG